MNHQFTSTWVRDVQFPTELDISGTTTCTSTGTGVATAATPVGFFQTLGILIMTLAISEVICLLLLQVVSRITWHSFYSEFSSFPLFILELAPIEEGVKEQVPIIETEQLDDILITSKWTGCNQDCQHSSLKKSSINSNICAICLCEYGRWQYDIEKWFMMCILFYYLSFFLSVEENSHIVLCTFLF
jgi:hypothetical protein